MNLPFGKKDQKIMLLLTNLLKRPQTFWVMGIAGALILAAILLCVLFPGKKEKAPRILTADDAISYLQSIGVESGYQNALSQLQEVHTSTVGGDHYFRLQQCYQGIPVYGRTVIYTADEQGNPLSVMQNVQDIPEELSLEPTVDLEQAREGIRAYLALNAPEEGIPDTLGDMLIPENLVIFNLQDAACLAYRIYTDSLCLLINAHTGEVVHSNTCAAYDAATFAETGNTLDVGRAKDGTYVLKDENTNTYVYSANNNYYALSLGNGKYFFAKSVLTLVTSQDAVFGNGDDSVSTDSMKSARTVLNQTNRIRSCFDDLRSGMIDALILVYDDRVGNNGDNAVAFHGMEDNYVDPILFDHSIPHHAYGITLGSVYSADPYHYTDVLAHEYTHLVTWEIVDWASAQGDTGALNEAFSDIFGELIEGEIADRDPDWLLCVMEENGEVQYVSRNLIVPSGGQYPVRNDAVYGTNINDRYDHDNIYNHSTVISHIAYKLYRGNLNDPASAIPLEQSKDLWFRTMLSLPPDADFLDCRNALEAAAEHMDLSNAQKQWIAQCFDNAGIYCTSVPHYSNMTVFGMDGTPYENYTVTVSTHHIKNHLIMPDESITVQYEPQKNGASFDLPLSGVCRVTLSDCSGSGQMMTLFFESSIPTGDSLHETVPIYTNFFQLRDQPYRTGEYVTEIDSSGEACFRRVLWDKSKHVLGGISTRNYCYEYIELQGNSPAYQKINQSIFEQAAAVMDTSYDGTFLSGLSDSSLSLVKYNCNGILCVEILRTNAYFDANTYSDHIYYSSQYLCFNLNTGEPLTLVDLTGISEETLLSEVRQIAWEGLNISLGDRLLDGVEEQISNMFLSDFQFTIESSEIILHFPSHEVSSTNTMFGQSIHTGLYISTDTTK